MSVRYVTVGGMKGTTWSTTWTPDRQGRAAAVLSSLCWKYREPEVRALTGAGAR